MTILDGHLSVFILNLEEPSFSFTICIISSISFLVLVFIDKKIKFHKVIGIEYMLRMKKFSNSETHFKRSIFLFFAIMAVLVSMSKKIFLFFYPETTSVSEIGYSYKIKVNNCFSKPDKNIITYNRFYIFLLSYLGSICHRS